MIPLVERARAHAGEREDRTVLVAPRAASDTEGSWEEWSYGDLLAASETVARRLLAGWGESAQDLEERPVVYLVPPGTAHVAVQWGIWRAGGIAVPLATMHPPPELEYVLEDTGAEIAIGAGALDPELDARLRPLAEARGLRCWTAGELVGAVPDPLPETLLPDVDPTRAALMVYTSGTTGRPKGAVTTHRNLEAQITALVDAWGWTAEDRILHVLPLHHVHGLVNVLACALWSGAVCEFLSAPGFPTFDAEEVWRRFGREEDPLSLFMAVPTIYGRLLAAWEGAPAEQRVAWSAGAARLRLMVSGSAALPVSRMERWQEVTGHRLLERYGMTEIGMALSNPLQGERRAGTVGFPLPGVEIRRVDETGQALAVGEQAMPGELEVRGPAVFREYWRRPEATREAFHDGWFRTGDVAVVEEGGYYRLLGRQSVDILKTGGYKVSALEIEEVLRTHPRIQDCAVVGVPDPEWGERVVAAVVPVALDQGAEGDEELTLEALRAWAKDRLAVYKVPSRLRCLEDLPRNAMGKVTKPAVVKLFQ